jgi:hypothetical protein
MLHDEVSARKAAPEPGSPMDAGTVRNSRGTTEGITARAGARTGAVLVGVAFLSFLAGCASAPPSPAASASRSTSATDYFPLDAGWKWAYELERDGQHLLAIYAVLERMPDGAIVQAGDQRISYAVTPRGIAMKEAGTVGDFVLENPVVLGTTWNVTAGTAKIVSVDKTVSGPAGEYKNCVVVEMLRHEPNRISRTTFASGVGPVDIEVQVESQGRFVTTTHATLRGTTRPGQDPLAAGP